LHVTSRRPAPDLPRSPLLPQTGFVTLTNPEAFMKYPLPVVQQLTKIGAGYVGAKGDFATDAKGVEQASSVSLSPVIEIPSKEKFFEWWNSPEYAAVKPLRTENSAGPIAVMEANLLPDGADTSAFGAYLSTIKKFTDKESFGAEYPPLMKANNAKFGATMIARVPFRGEGAEKMIAQENCENYDFAVLIGFKTLEDAVNYVHDEEFGAKQTAVRLATTEGPLAAIEATNKTRGPFPQYTGVPHDR
jgi:uncharacterized protein (DUF1330 family)